MAHEKLHDRRAAKGRGESDMDVAALAAEKAEQQAQQREAEAADYSEDKEYTEAEWLEWEAQLRDELNWLGQRNMGVKGDKLNDVTDDTHGGLCDYKFLDMTFFSSRTSDAKCIPTSIPKPSAWTSATASSSTGWCA